MRLKLQKKSMSEIDGQSRRALHLSKMAFRAGGDICDGIALHDLALITAVA